MSPSRDTRGADERTPLPGARPLTARSVVASVLLGTEPPRLPVAVLVRTTELFGINAGATRTALSRMVAAGELTADGGRYALAGRLLERQRRQGAGRAARVRAWPGRPGGRGPWRQAVVVAERRSAADRTSLRAAMTAARFAPLREGVWLRPDNLPDPAPVAEGCDWQEVVPDHDPVALAARLWDLDRWSADALVLLAAMDDLLAPLERGDRHVLGPGFVLSAAVLRHFVHDPLLPAALLPPGWPGTDLRRGYDRYDAAYRAVLSGVFRELRPAPGTAGGRAGTVVP